MSEHRLAAQFAAYLSTLGITSRLEEKPGGVEVWVHSEDRVAEAARELEQYQKNPADPRYARALRGHDLRHKRPKSPAPWPLFSPRPHRPVRSLLVLLSIAVAVFSRFGEQIDPWVSWLAIMRIVPSEHMIVWESRLLIEALRGEVWRFVTPMFLHFGMLHLIFNMLWLGSLGGQVESRHGSLPFLLLVMLWSAASNTCQLLLTRDPLFGGMSGVNFALFCYIWLRAHYDPGSGFEMPAGTIVLMLGWFFLCLTGWMGPIANGAHIGGLVAGGLTALAAMAWRRLRPRGMANEE